MINLLKSLGLTIFMSFFMIFAADSAGKGLADLTDEDIFEPRPLRPSSPPCPSTRRAPLLDISIALECHPCTANRKEFSGAKVELLRCMDAIGLTAPSAIAIKAMLRNGVAGVYADLEKGDRAYGDMCMLALAGRAGRFGQSTSDLKDDIRVDVVSNIAEKLTSLSFSSEEFAVAKGELLSKWITPEFTQEASRIIWEMLRGSIDAI